MNNRQQLDVKGSSSVLEAEYDRDAQRLYIIWNTGKRGYYPDISPEIIKQIESEASFGSAVSTHIKKKGYEFIYQ